MKHPDICGTTTQQIRHLISILRRFCKFKIKHDFKKKTKNVFNIRPK